MKLTPENKTWIGDDESIVTAIRLLECYANSGLGVGIEIDGHTGIRCQITGKVNESGETILEAVENAIKKLCETWTENLS